MTFALLLAGLGVRRATLGVLGTVAAVLAGREGVSGHAEKASRSVTP